VVIRPGGAWGEVGVPPTDVAHAGSEAELAALWLGGAKEAVLHDGSLRLATGTARRAPQVRATIDAVVVIRKVGTVAARHAMFGSMTVFAGVGPRGLRAIVTNSGFWRGRRIVPAAHPNDGLLDVLELASDMTVLQRWMAWRRSSRNDHLPHPALRVHRSGSWDGIDGTFRVRVDGGRWQPADRITCEVVPDAMVVWM
jgi:hypothetical protein